MTTETFDKGKKILDRIVTLQAHLKMRSIEEPAKSVSFTSGGTPAISSFLPMPMETLQNKYRQNVQAEIVRLQDVFNNL